MVYDAVVAGLGIHGSSTIAQLAERGKKVIGFEKFQSGGHPHGSSHGRSRIIRQAYFEDPRYVPMLKRSFTLWRKLEELNQTINPSINEKNTNSERLLTMTGGNLLCA